MELITNSMQIANTRSKRSPNRRRHHAVKPSTRNEDADMWTKGIRDVVTAEEREPQQAITYVQGSEYLSNVTGEKLDKDKMKGAGKEEMKYFERVGVYKKVPRTQAVERTGIKWVDVTRWQVSRQIGGETVHRWS